MQNTTAHTPSTLKLERFFAVIGTVVCLIVSVRVWLVFSPQQSMWPLPDLYLLEVLAASILGVSSIWGNESGLSPLRGTLAWVVVGILFAVVIIGSWSIGYVFIPVTALFAITAILSDRRQGRSIIIHLGIGLVAAFAQGALMLIVIRLLYP